MNYLKKKLKLKEALEPRSRKARKGVIVTFMMSQGLFVFEVDYIVEWYKHMTGSHDDPDISDAWDEFGDAGYVVFFVILEIYGQEFSHLDTDKKLTISKTFLRRKLRKSWTKVEQILNFYQEKKRIFYLDNGKQVSIEIPKYIDLSSNWTKWGKKRPTPAPMQVATENQSIELEEELELEEEEEIYNPKGLLSLEKLRTCPHQEIISLYHKTLPRLSKVREWTEKRQKELRSRWREDSKRQNLDWWKRFFEYIGESQFLSGENDRNWQPNLEWIVTKNHFVNIIEGKYHGE